MKPLAVGVDVGGTKTSAGLVTSTGQLTKVRSVPTPAAHGGDAVLDAIAALVRDVSEGNSPVGIGVGAAGVVDPAHGRIAYAADTLTGWAGTEVSAGLRDRLGVSLVEVCNDVNAHTVGEAWCGAGAGADSVLLLAVGTGIGAGLVLDGKLRTGAHDVAGEVGHIPAVGAEGLLCSCGRLGHVEALAAGPAMVRRYMALGGTSNSVDARHLAVLAHAGDAVAEGVIREAAACLGRTLAGLITALDPAVVVMSGGITGMGAMWWQPFESACRADLIDVLAGLRILPASLGNEAAMVGAARVVFQAVEAAQR